MAKRNPQRGSFAVLGGAVFLDEAKVHANIDNTVLDIDIDALHTIERVVLKVNGREVGDVMLDIPDTRTELQ